MTIAAKRRPGGQCGRVSQPGLGHNSSVDLHLSGKVVLITGGTDGLGAALADRLTEEGARVAVCGRDPGRLAATEQRLRDAGGDALAVQADVTRPADLERFVDAAVSRWGRLDGLVNNAGKSSAGRIDRVSDDDWIGDLYPAGPGWPVRGVRRPGGLPPVRPLLLRDRLGRQPRRRKQPCPLTRRPCLRAAPRERAGRQRVMELASTRASTAWSEGRSRPARTTPLMSRSPRPARSGLAGCRRGHDVVP